MIKIAGRGLQLLYVLYAMLLFFGLMIPVFLFSLLSMLAGSIRGGNLIYRACMVWGDVWFPLVGIWHTNIFEEPLRKDEAYIFVANHISYLDAALMVKTIRQPLRPLGKSEPGKIPLFGYIYRNAIVSVDRSSAANRSRSVQRLKSVLRKGISILVFPEGTFNESHQPLLDFYDGAFRIAIETGTPIKPILFLDAYARLPYDRSFGLTPGKSRAVFLKEIPVAGYTAKDVNKLRDEVHEAMRVKLLAYEASWIR